MRKVLRVGLFGHLGACNIGNDASMEAVLSYLRAEQPAAVIDAMCPGPKTVRDRYGIGATRMVWYHRFDHDKTGPSAAALKVIGKGIDAFRTAAWVRRHDVVIVPGAGVLESSLPLWPWGMPYAMFLLSGFGRIFGTKVAFVSVGAGAIKKRPTRWLSNWAARLAYYRSYRDAGALEAMRARGVDVTRDHVFHDLAFGLPEPPDDPGDPAVVAVGVMEYRGSNDQRGQADEIYSAYVGKMKQFVRWLVDNDRRVRLFVGDTNGSDDTVVQEILADVRKYRPDLDPSWVVAEPVTSFADVMRAMMHASSVVAIRYHNIVCSLKIAKPTISISYSPKHDALMAEMGLPEFCLDVNDFKVSELTELFTSLESRSAELRRMMKERNAIKARLVDAQFAELSTVLFEEKS
jgi:polysaccharide pyruvyl transferase WcaK-like protein